MSVHTDIFLHATGDSRGLCRSKSSKSSSSVVAVLCYDMRPATVTMRCTTERFKCFGLLGITKAMMASVTSGGHQCICIIAGTTSTTVAAFAVDRCCTCSNDVAVTRSVTQRTWLRLASSSHSTSIKAVSNMQILNHGHDKSFRIPCHARQHCQLLLLIS